MTIRHARWIALGLLPLVAACARTETAAQNTATTVQAATQAQLNPTLSTSDEYFLDQAARAGAAEVQAGQLAERQAGRAVVRRFAAEMVADHTQANQALLALAQRKHTSPPTDPDLAHQQAISDLAKLHGRAFDRTYLNAQATDHVAVVKLFQTEAEQGTDPEVKEFAAHLLPTLRHHLAEARHLGGRPTAS